MSWNLTNTQTCCTIIYTQRKDGNEIKQNKSCKVHINPFLEFDYVH